MNYQPIIGLEVHVELNTKSKMFCRDSTHYFGEDPNTHTCPVCLALPGALPFINKKAIEYCAMIGLALGCKVNHTSRFERKNYFYPDLPKGYQISQYKLPLTTGGLIRVLNKEGKESIIRINRVHMEEDTGKLTHTGNKTLVDFNRAGVPLVEIVTEPDFRDVEEIRNYAKKLQQVCRYLGVSEADMEKGQMRLEANVSVRVSNLHPKGAGSELPDYRVELKNINSFRFMVAAVEYEIKRQIEALEKGEKLQQETRGWDEDKKVTYVQRSKEEAMDYRYFPEPDLPEVRFEDHAILHLQEQIPELPWDRSARFENVYGLTSAQAAILTDSKETADYFEETVKDGKSHDVDTKQIANHIINKKVDINQILPAQVIEEIIGKSSGVISDEVELERLAKEAMEENSKAVEDFKKGKETALQALIGGVQRKALGKADTSALTGIFRRLLTNS